MVKNFQRPTASILSLVSSWDLFQANLDCVNFLEAQDHTFIVTSHKDGSESLFEKELPGAEVFISQPFWPAYLTEERISKAKKLKLAITAGIGSDHVDLEAAIKTGITVAELTYCLESGQLAGYAGDVWFLQPPPKNHPWRTMPHHGMTFM